MLSPDVRVLVLTSDDDEESIVAAMNAGAVGYLLKQVEGTSLLSAVRTIARGHSLIDPSLARRMITWMEQTKERSRRSSPVSPSSSCGSWRCSPRV